MKAQSNAVLRLALAGMALWWAWQGVGAVPGALHFQTTTNGFVFNTGYWSGQTRANQKSFGLVPVRMSSNQAVVARSMGWLAVYRVFDADRRYGDGAWDWASQAAVQPRGSLLITSPPETNRPFALIGEYSWINERTVDLHLTVFPQTPLRGFEIFVASYFSPAFSNALVVTGPDMQLARRARAPVPSRYSKYLPGVAIGDTMTESASLAETPAQLLRATRELGEWLMFPLDDARAPLLRDGRWQREPHPVEWAIQPRVALPVAVRHAPGWPATVAVMGDPEECFAVAMPQEAEGHYSVYLSLFGRDLPPGQPARTRVRLQALESAAWPALARAYDAFIYRRASSDEPGAPARIR